MEETQMSRVLRRLVGDYEENSGLEEARAMRQRQVWGQKQRPQPRVSHVLVLIFSLEQEHLGRKGVWSSQGGACSPLE